MENIKEIIRYIFEGFVAGFHWCFGLGGYEDVTFLQGLLGFIVICGLFVGFVYLIYFLIILIKIIISKL